MLSGKNVEEIIREAIAAGEFDNLEGRGKPIDLTAYFNTPAEFRVGYSLLKSNKFVPEEVEILKEIGYLREKIKISKEESKVKKLTKQLHERQMALSILNERRGRRR
ncbi:MAG: DUF1992 domain-containing protein [Pyrinomonadaceae bacterium]